MNYFNQHDIELKENDDFYSFSKEGMEIKASKKWGSKQEKSLLFNQDIGYIVIPVQDNQDQFLNFTFQNQVYSFAKLISDGGTHINDLFEKAKKIIGK